MIRPWRETSRTTLVETRVFELQERRATNPRTDRELPFFVLDSVDWVNVIPLTDEGRVLLVRQYRLGTGAVTLEIPGGMIEPGEAPEAGARRELREETGFEADEVELLGVVDTNPAIQTNSTHTFLARGLRRAPGGTDFDPAEDIELVEVELSQLDELVATGAITHSLVIAAFYWLSRRRALAARVEEALDQLAGTQQDAVAALAKRINERLTPDDLRSPQDLPELANDTDFNYQDGMLAGFEAARMALRRLLREAP